MARNHLASGSPTRKIPASTIVQMSPAKLPEIVNLLRLPLPLGSPGSPYLGCLNGMDECP